jgi:hypothetical protein
MGWSVKYGMCFRMLGEQGSCYVVVIWVYSFLKPFKVQPFMRQNWN